MFLAFLLFGKKSPHFFPPEQITALF